MMKRSRRQARKAGLCGRLKTLTIQVVRRVLPIAYERAEMNELSEKLRRGEVGYTPEEIYTMVVCPRRYGGNNKPSCKLKVSTHFRLYEKNEAQMTALQEQLHSEKRKVAKQDKEISKLFFYVTS